MRKDAARALFVTTMLAGVPAFGSDAGALFDEGVKLLDAGRIAEACPKLEESQRLEPAAGTLLNLAACYEKSDRPLLALATFRRASTAAAARGRTDWQKIADDHVTRLDATLPKLTIHAGSTPDVHVTLDGARLAPAALDMPFAVEPGTHIVAADAPDRRPFTSLVAVRAATSVTIPTLEMLPPRDEAPQREPSRDPPALTRPFGFVVGGIGIAGVAFGVVGAVVAGTALGDAKAACPSYPNRCGAAADAPNERARTWSTYATIGFVAGGALVATGVVLYFWPSKQTTVSVGVSGAGLFARGEF
jgi:hypothetical protein